jgi:hypothetical protein
VQISNKDINIPGKLYNCSKINGTIIDCIVILMLVDSKTILEYLLLTVFLSVHVS